MNATTQSLSHPSFLTRIFAPLALAIAVIAGSAALQPAAAGKIYFEGGLFGSAAVRGYDVVAYFTQAKPVEGKRDFSHKWNNAEWRFASAANRDLFAANPENTLRNMAAGAPGRCPKATPRPSIRRPGVSSTASCT